MTDIESKRMVLTFTPKAAETIRELAADLTVKPPEAVRRSVLLMRWARELPDGAFLAVVYPDKSIGRIVLVP